MKVLIKLGEQSAELSFDRSTPLVEDLISGSRTAGLYSGHRPCFTFGGKIIQEQDFIKELSFYKITDGCTINIIHRFGTCDDNCDITCYQRDLESRRDQKKKLISIREKLKTYSSCICCSICEKKSCS